MSNTTRIVASIAAALIACDDPGSGGSTADGTDTSTPSEVVETPQEIQSVTGRIGTKSFTARDALAHEFDDEIYVVLSDSTGICADFTNKVSSGGVSQIQLWIPRTVMSATVQVTAMAATVASVCPTGAEIDDSLLAHVASTDTASVTITSAPGDRIEGTVTATFDDGSSVAGAFSAVACAGPAEGDGATCR